MSADSVYNIDPPDTDFERGKLNSGWVRRDNNFQQLILSMIYEPIKNVPSKTAMNVPKKYAKNKTIMPMKNVSHMPTMYVTVMPTTSTMYESSMHTTPTMYVNIMHHKNKNRIKN